MHSFLSKVFGRKKDDKETSPTTLAPGELLDGKFEAVSPSVSPSAANFLELDQNTNGRDGKEKEVAFSTIKAKSRPAPEAKSKKLDSLPHLSLSFEEAKESSSSDFLFSADSEAQALSDAVIGERRLNPLEALILIRACSQAITAHGLETLGIMHPHWYSTSPDTQRRLISQFLHTLSLKNASDSSPSTFESEINSTCSLHDVAAVLRWGLRHLKLEGNSFGTDEGWYKAFFDAEAAAEYPPKSFSEKLAPTLPLAHLELLTATLQLFSSLAAHSEVNSTSGSKLSKLFGIWLLTARQIEDKDDWASFYTRWERTGRQLEHLFLARIRDENTDQRLPVRLLELVRKYPYTQGISSPTTDLQILPRPRFTTPIYDALFVRIEIEFPTGARKPKTKMHPLNLLADAFSTQVATSDSEHAGLWAKITAASKDGSNPSPLSNIFADETIRFLSIIPDPARKEQEAKSPAFNLFSPSSPTGKSFASVDTEKAATPAPTPAVVAQHKKFATEPITPVSSTAVGNDWAQFSSSGFLDSTPGIAPLVATLFDQDIERTVPPDLTLSRKSSRRAKAASRKSIEVSRSPPADVSYFPAVTETPANETKPTVKAAKLEIIQFDEAFIDFWSDSLLDPITAKWPTFIICKFKSTLAPQLTYGPTTEGQPQKRLNWLILEQLYTVRAPPALPTPDPTPVASPVEVGARATSPTPSASGRKRFNFWSMSRTTSSTSAGSQKGKKKEQVVNVGEMGELIEEASAEQVKNAYVARSRQQSTEQKAANGQPEAIFEVEEGKVEEKTTPEEEKKAKDVAADVATGSVTTGVAHLVAPGIESVPSEEAKVEQVTAPISESTDVTPTQETVPAVEDEIAPPSLDVAAADDKPLPEVNLEVDEAAAAAEPAYTEAEQTVLPAEESEIVASAEETLTEDKSVEEVVPTAEPVEVVPLAEPAEAAPIAEPVEVLLVEAVGPIVEAGVTSSTESIEDSVPQVESKAETLVPVGESVASEPIQEEATARGVVPPAESLEAASVKEVALAVEPEVAVQDKEAGAEVESAPEEVEAKVDGVIPSPEPLEVELVEDVTPIAQVEDALPAEEVTVEGISTLEEEAKVEELASTVEPAEIVHAQEDSKVEEFVPAVESLEAVPVEEVEPTADIMIASSAEEILFEDKPATEEPELEILPPAESLVAVAPAEELPAGESEVAPIIEDAVTEDIHADEEQIQVDVSHAESVQVAPGQQEETDAEDVVPVAASLDVAPVEEKLPIEENKVAPPTADVVAESTSIPEDGVKVEEDVPTVKLIDITPATEEESKVDEISSPMEATYIAPGAEASPAVESGVPAVVDDVAEEGSAAQEAHADDVVPAVGSDEIKPVQETESALGTETVLLDTNAEEDVEVDEVVPVTEPVDATTVDELTPPEAHQSARSDVEVAVEDELVPGQSNSVEAPMPLSDNIDNINSSAPREETTVEASPVTETVHVAHEEELAAAVETDDALATPSEESDVSPTLPTVAETEVTLEAEGSVLTESVPEPPIVLISQEPLGVEDAIRGAEEQERLSDSSAIESPLAPEAIVPADDHAEVATTTLLASEEILSEPAPVADEEELSVDAAIDNVSASVLEEAETTGFVDGTLQTSLLEQNEELTAAQVFEEPSTTVPATEVTSVAEEDETIPASAITAEAVADAPAQEKADETETLLATPVVLSDSTAEASVQDEAQFEDKSELLEKVFDEPSLAASDEVTDAAVPQNLDETLPVKIVDVDQEHEEVYPATPPGLEPIPYVEEANEPVNTSTPDYPTSVESTAEKDNELAFSAQAESIASVAKEGGPVDIVASSTAHAESQTSDEVTPFEGVDPVQEEISTPVLEAAVTITDNEALENSAEHEGIYSIVSSESVSSVDSESVLESLKASEDVTEDEKDVDESGLEGSVVGENTDVGVTIPEIRTATLDDELLSHESEESAALAEGTQPSPYTDTLVPTMATPKAEPTRLPTEGGDVTDSVVDESGYSPLVADESTMSTEIVPEEEISTSTNRSPLHEHVAEDISILSSAKNEGDTVGEEEAVFEVPEADDAVTPELDQSIPLEAQTSEAVTGLEEKDTAANSTYIEDDNTVHTDLLDATAEITEREPSLATESVSQLEQPTDSSTIQAPTLSPVENTIAEEQAESTISKPDSVEDAVLSPEVKGAVLPVAVVADEEVEPAKYETALNDELASAHAEKAPSEDDIAEGISAAIPDELTTIRKELDAASATASQEITVHEDMIDDATPEVHYPTVIEEEAPPAVTSSSIEATTTVVTDIAPTVLLAGAEVVSDDLVSFVVDKAAPQDSADLGPIETSDPRVIVDDEISAEDLSPADDTVKKESPTLLPTVEPGLVLEPAVAPEEPVTLPTTETTLDASESISSESSTINPALKSDDEITLLVEEPTSGQDLLHAEDDAEDRQGVSNTADITFPAKSVPVAFDEAAVEGQESTPLELTKDEEVVAESAESTPSVESTETRIAEPSGVGDENIVTPSSPPVEPVLGAVEESTLVEPVETSQSVIDDNKALVAVEGTSEPVATSVVTTEEPVTTAVEEKRAQVASLSAVQQAEDTLVDVVLDDEAVPLEATQPAQVQGAIDVQLDSAERVSPSGDPSSPEDVPLGDDNLPGDKETHESTPISEVQLAENPDVEDAQGTAEVTMNHSNGHGLYANADKEDTITSETDADTVEPEPVVILEADKENDKSHVIKEDGAVQSNFSPESSAAEVEVESVVTPVASAVVLMLETAGPITLEPAETDLVNDKRGNDAQELQHIDAEIQDPEPVEGVQESTEDFSFANGPEHTAVRNIEETAALSVEDAPVSKSDPGLASVILPEEALVVVNAQASAVNDSGPSQVDVVIDKEETLVTGNQPTQVDDVVDEVHAEDSILPEEDAKNTPQSSAATNGEAIVDSAVVPEDPMASVVDDAQTGLLPTRETGSTIEVATVPATTREDEEIDIGSSPESALNLETAVIGSEDQKEVVIEEAPVAIIADSNQEPSQVSSSLIPEPSNILEEKDTLLVSDIVEPISTAEAEPTDEPIIIPEPLASLEDSALEVQDAVPLEPSQKSEDYVVVEEEIRVATSELVSVDPTPPVLVQHAETSDTTSMTANEPAPVGDIDKVGSTSVQHNPETTQELLPSSKVEGEVEVITHEPIASIINDIAKDVVTEENINPPNTLEEFAVTSAEVAVPEVAESAPAEQEEFSETAEIPEHKEATIDVEESTVLDDSVSQSTPVKTAEEMSIDASVAEPVPSMVEEVVQDTAPESEQTVVPATVGKSAPVDDNIHESASLEHVTEESPNFSSEATNKSEAEVSLDSESQPVTEVTTIPDESSTSVMKEDTTEPTPAADAHSIANSEIVDDIPVVAEDAEVSEPVLVEPLEISDTAVVEDEDKAVVVETIEVSTPADNVADQAREIALVADASLASDEPAIIADENTPLAENVKEETQEVEPVAESEPIVEAGSALEEPASATVEEPSDVSDSLPVEQELILEAAVLSEGEEGLVETVEPVVVEDAADLAHEITPVADVSLASDEPAVIADETIPLAERVEEETQEIEPVAESEPIVEAPSALEEPASATIEETSEVSDSLPAEPEPVLETALPPEGLVEAVEPVVVEDAAENSSIIEDAAEESHALSTEAEPEITPVPLAAPEELDIAAAEETSETLTDSVVDEVIWEGAVLPSEETAPVIEIQEPAVVEHLETEEIAVEDASEEQSSTNSTAEVAPASDSATIEEPAIATVDDIEGDTTAFVGPKPVEVSEAAVVADDNDAPIDAIGAPVVENIVDSPPAEGVTEETHESPSVPEPEAESIHSSDSVPTAEEPVVASVEEVKVEDLNPAEDEEVSEVDILPKDEELPIVAEEPVLVEDNVRPEPSAVDETSAPSEDSSTDEIVQETTQLLGEQLPEDQLPEDSSVVAAETEAETVAVADLANGHDSEASKPEISDDVPAAEVENIEPVDSETTSSSNDIQGHDQQLVADDAEVVAEEAKVPVIASESDALSSTPDEETNGYHVGNGKAELAEDQDADITDDPIEPEGSSPSEEHDTAHDTLAAPVVDKIDELLSGAADTIDTKPINEALLQPGIVEVDDDIATSATAEDVAL